MIRPRILQPLFLLLVAHSLSAQLPPLPPDLTIIAVNETGRLIRSEDHGSSWSPVSGVPVRVLPAALAGESLPLTALAVPALNPEDRSSREEVAASPGLKRPGYLWVPPGAPVLAAFGGKLMESRDTGLTWREVVTEESINASTYITAIAVDPKDHDHWVVGTSYDGLFRTTDRGRSWVDLTANRGNWPSYLGTGFFEEFERIWFTGSGDLVLGLGFGQGFLRLGINADGEPINVSRLRLTLAGADSITGAALGLGTGGGRPTIGQVAGESAAAAAVASGASGTRAAAAIGGSIALSTVLQSDRRRPSPRETGIYLSAENASPERLPDYFALMERYDYTKIVVDFKDDLGRLTYASALSTPREAGAVEPRLDPQALVDAAHAQGVKVVARVVVFKDRVLYAYDNYRYAIWDSSRDRPWGVFRTFTDEESGERRTVQVEHWVDPFSPDVWEYNVSIAEELQELGVDEIQFDYIRFPSDGNSATVLPRYQPEGADRVQALEGFLHTARERLTIPISIDVFGFNAWARMSYLGQDITRLSTFVDVISPMFYPSHFARSFLPQFSYLDRSRVIYDLGSRRAHSLAASGGATTIRPYVQTFLIGSELQFDRPTYLRYVDLQLDGVAEAEAATAYARPFGGVAGYSLWNASGRYYMLR